MGILWVTTKKSNVYIYNGNSWQRRGSVEGNGENAIAVAPNGDIYVGSDSLLYRSTNGGTSWNTVFTIGRYNYIEEIIISNSGEVYFATNNNVYVPDNSSWRRVTTNGLSDHSIIVYPIALAPNGTLYATEGDPTSPTVRCYIIRSTDAGNSWLRSTTFFTYPVYRLTIVDNNTMFAAASRNGILKSTDGGQNWVRCDTISGGNPWAWEISYNSKMGMLFADIDFNISCNAFISTDLGENWEMKNGNLRNPGFGQYCFAFNPITGDTYLRLGSYSANIFYGPVYRFAQ